MGGVFGDLRAGGWGFQEGKAGGGNYRNGREKKGTGLEFFSSLYRFD